MHIEGKVSEYAGKFTCSILFSLMIYKSVFKTLKKGEVEVDIPATRK